MPSLYRIHSGSPAPAGRPPCSGAKLPALRGVKESTVLLSPAGRYEYLPQPPFDPEPGEANPSAGMVVASDSGGAPTGRRLPFTSVMERTHTTNHHGAGRKPARSPERIDTGAVKKSTKPRTCHSSSLPCTASGRGAAK
ncbi:hypothetical protein RRG08_043070 [Elysia crispata]|uniref:Uncharacterized protein n=1 Tax=Elysia crispata TaxID=231223 RepID=A0AAE0XYB0_9GAST|nr:hypothetical protein RRG08_043070 [Elysia crispata]